MSKNKYRKPGGDWVTPGFIQGIKENYPSQYPTPKYIQFCERAINQGFDVKLYMPISGGVSKYVTVYHKSKKFKVRFSNHKPIRELEIRGTCDFFVGVTNLGVTTTEMAWEATLKHFSQEKTLTK